MIRKESKKTLSIVKEFIDQIEIHRRRMKCQNRLLLGKWLTVVKILCLVPVMNAMVPETEEIPQVLMPIEKMDCLIYVDFRVSHPLLFSPFEV